MGRRPVTYVIDFSRCREDDITRIGGKCTSLGALVAAGLPVPPGFAVTTQAFADALAGERGAEIGDLLGAIDTADVRGLDEASARIRALVEATPVPSQIDEAIRAAYAGLSAGAGASELPVAVRSSATAEDLPDASFAGQQDTYLWVVGADGVVEHVRRCWASLYTSRAIAYRHDAGFPHDRVQMGVAVQRMVSARAAGVAMTLNPANGDRSKIVIDASFGLGESVVGGLVTPDNFVVDKVMLEVVRRTISTKHLELVPDLAARRVVERTIEGERRDEPSLTLEQVKAVAGAAKLAERHFGCPQDVEWAIEGDAVLLLQSRPETVWSRADAEPRPAATPGHAAGVQSVLDALLNPLASRRPPGDDP
jgi:pyruvate,water dikinase